MYSIYNEIVLVLSCVDTSVKNKQHYLNHLNLCCSMPRRVKTWHNTHQYDWHIAREALPVASSIEFLKWYILTVLPSTIRDFKPSKLWKVSSRNIKFKDFQNLEQVITYHICWSRVKLKYKSHWYRFLFPFVSHSSTD